MPMSLIRNGCVVSTRRKLLGVLFSAVAAFVFLVLARPTRSR